MRVHGARGHAREQMVPVSLNVIGFERGQTAARLCTKEIEKLIGNALIADKRQQFSF